MILVLANHRELTTESNKRRLSIMRFCNSQRPASSGTGELDGRHTWLPSSSKTWSYSLKATQKMIEVTFSKQCIHFFRSLLCPPTSNMLSQC